MKRVGIIGASALSQLPLILRNADGKIPFLDTTMIHVKAIVDQLLPETDNA
jgi:aspartate/glutamate racemase